MKTKHIHRDIPLFVSFAGSVIILLLLVAACDNKDYSKASPFDNAVYIDVAKVKDVANFTFNNLKQTGQQELSAVLAYPAEQDIDVNFQVDSEVVTISFSEFTSPLSFLHSMSSSPKET